MRRFRIPTDAVVAVVVLLRRLFFDTDFDSDPDPDRPLPSGVRVLRSAYCVDFYTPRLGAFGFTVNPGGQELLDDLGVGERMA